MSSTPSPFQSPVIALSMGGLAYKHTGGWGDSARFRLPNSTVKPCKTSGFCRTDQWTANPTFPSPLKSPVRRMAEVDGDGRLTVKLVWVPILKVPSPFPVSTETVAVTNVATARSAIPSPLRSATAMESASVPVPGPFVTRVNVPSPLPRNTVRCRCNTGRQVGNTVSIKVGSGNKERCGARLLTRRRRRERPIPVAKQNDRDLVALLPLFATTPGPVCHLG